MGLQHAAERAGREDFPFLDDVYDAIVHYMQHKCPLRLLPVEKLVERIGFMLKRMGCEHIAMALPPMAPPITISLEQAAHEAGENYELGFFANLKSAVHEAKQAGAAALVFEDVRSSVRIVTRKKEWDQSCEDLEKEMVDFLRKLGEKPKREAQGRRIHIPLAKSVAAP